jgi:hypothetical protein
MKEAARRRLLHFIGGTDYFEAAPATAEAAAFAAEVTADAAADAVSATADAAAAATGATAEAAAAAAAGAAFSSFLPQAARATTATREANRSDLFMIYILGVQ